MKTCSDQALRLIEEIISGEIKVLAEKEENLLLEHREACLRKILPMLALEVTQIQAGEEWDEKKLEWTLKLSAFFQEPKAFSWICELHRHADELVEKLGDSFIALYWTNFLLSTVENEIEKLKEEIADPEVDDQFRCACLEIFPQMVSLGRMERGLAVEYFQGLYKKILEGDIENSSWIAGLLEASLDLWPGEFMEDIREIFGLDLVEGEFVDLNMFLNVIKETKEETLDSLKGWLEGCHALEPLVPNAFMTDEISEEIERDMKEVQELEGQDPELLAFGGVVRFSSNEAGGDEVDISYKVDGKELQSHLSSFSLKDKRRYYSLLDLIPSRPERGVEVSLDLLVKYPQTPSLYNYLYISYNLLDMKHQAMAVLKDLRAKFPSYLLGKIEYANYLLRRGEPEKMAVLFSQTFSLNRLCPERDVFYVMEWVKFLHVVGWYFLQMGMTEYAKHHLELLKKIAPQSSEAQDLEWKIENDRLLSSFDDDLLEFED